MVAPVIVAAGIAAAASLASAKNQSNAASSATKQGRQFSLDMYTRQKADQEAWQRGWVAEREDSQVQRRVADAQAAGIHPLYAMGSAGGGGANYSYGTSIPGYPSGGAQRSGIGEAGAHIARGITQNEANKVQRQAFALEASRVAAQVARDDAQANYYNALAAKASQEANSGPRMTEDGTVVVPLGERPGTPLIQGPIVQTKTPRATRITPHQNSPLWVTAEVNGRKVWALNPDLGLDELSQIIVGAQMAGHRVRKGAIESGLYDPKSPNPAKEPMKYFRYWMNK